MESNNKEMPSTSLIKVILQDLSKNGPEASSANGDSEQAPNQVNIKQEEQDTKNLPIAVGSNLASSSTAPIKSRPTFASDADDSSDEEEAQERKRISSTSSRWGRFQTNNRGFKNRSVFEVHSIAIEKMFSGEIEDFYRKMKQEILVGSEISTTLSVNQISFRDWLIEGIQSALVSILKKAEDFVARYGAEGTIKNYWEKCSQELEPWLASICAKERNLLRACKEKDINSKLLENDLRAIYQHFSDYLTTCNVTFSRAELVKPETVEIF